MAIIRILALCAIVPWITSCLDEDALSPAELQTVYEAEVQSFELTKDVNAICDAAITIGSRQNRFPAPIKERKALFIAHIKQGLREAHKQGLTDKEIRCDWILWENLYTGKNSIILRNSKVADCLSDYRLASDNGLFTADEYDACAKKYDYTP